MRVITKSIQLQDGRTITIETGKLAKQADGAVVVRMGKAMLLVTVTANKTLVSGADFLPLSVDYQEKFSAAGRIPGGFLRREGRSGDHEVLISRLVDRVIRPLFPSTYRYETQVNILLISSDPHVEPGDLAALGASSALSISCIPFLGPISEVRVARIQKKFVINPNPELLEDADIDLVVGATEDNIIMVEGGMDEVQEEEMIEAIQYAHEAIKEQCKTQRMLVEEIDPCIHLELPKIEELDYQDQFKEDLYAKIYSVAKLGITNKKERSKAFSKIKDECVTRLNDLDARTDTFDDCFNRIKKQAVRDLMINERIRIDGRSLDEIRPISTEIDYLPSAHGSALFTRGETQSLTTVTLGSKLDEQIMDRVASRGYSRIMLHYNFPGFSTGEVKPNRGPSRREIGHGALAMRALKCIIPKSEEQNPYTIRIVSDILESNGSSSMATVCASSMALMDAGVPVPKSVSGIAMGLVIDEKTGKYAILSDILGDEDQLGDMDFKVTGTQKGITACQMDIKVSGLATHVLADALQQAKKGRLYILAEMEKTISNHRSSYKEHTPRIMKLMIKKEMIGAVIGPSGKIIQEIQKNSGASITIDERDNNAVVSIFAPNQGSIDKAEKSIREIVAEPVVGAVYTGKVKSIKDFGAFVEFMPGKDGLLHISEIKWERIDNLADILEKGEEIQVKLIGIDPKTGKFRLSRKELLPQPV